MTDYVLKSVSIRREEWRPNSPLRAVVEFKTIAGELRIDLGEEASAAVLNVIADQVVAAATVRAADMKAAFAQGAAQIALPAE